ncbi:MAG: hypothetical protein ACR2KW_01835 [Rubrobacter sp.]
MTPVTKGRFTAKVEGSFAMLVIGMWLLDHKSRYLETSSVPAVKRSGLAPLSLSSFNHASTG